MYGVAGKPALQKEAAFFQRPCGGAIVDIAGCFNAEDSWQTERDSCERLNGFDHQTLAPMAAREQIANVDDVAVWTSVEHADEFAALLQGDDVRKR